MGPMDPSRAFSRHDVVTGSPACARCKSLAPRGPGTSPLLLLLHGAVTVLHP